MALITTRAASRAVVLVATAVLLGGCGSVTPSPAGTALPASPEPTTTSHRLGLDWQKVESVEAPPGNGSTTPPPYENPNGLGHPMAYQGGQADIVDVVAYGPGFSAVGFLETSAGPKAAAWHSADGTHWSLVSDFPTADASVARAIATGRGGLVAVGAEGPRPAAWHSSDGVAWRRSPEPAAAAGAEMSAVLATPSGYVAGGHSGARAALWTSSDGIAWSPLPDGPALSAARVEGFAVFGDRIVAVGSALADRTPSGAAVWTSADGATWQRLPTTHDLAIGPMHAVIATDDGFLAVGTNDAGTRAVVWSSGDGPSWLAQPDDVALDNHGLQIEMRDVARVGSGYVAVGHLLFGTQYPSGVIWSSPNGMTWTRAPDAPMLQQAKLFAVTANADTAVAVGTFGSPDFAIPTIWISPPAP